MPLPELAPDELAVTDVVVVVAGGGVVEVGGGVVEVGGGVVVIGEVGPVGTDPGKEGSEPGNDEGRPPPLPQPASAINAASMASTARADRPHPPGKTMIHGRNPSPRWPSSKRDEGGRPAMWAAKNVDFRG